MAIKFDSGKVRLWKGIKESGEAGIGIKFSKGCSKRELDDIHKAIGTILALKYGKGKK